MKKRLNKLCEDYGEEMICIAGVACVALAWPVAFLLKWLGFYE